MTTANRRKSHPKRTVRSRRVPARPRRPDPRRIPVGVVGLGLMGTSITACLLAAGLQQIHWVQRIAQHGSLPFDASCLRITEVWPLAAPSRES